MINERRIKEVMEGVNNLSDLERASVICLLESLSKRVGIDMSSDMDDKKLLEQLLKSSHALSQKEWKLIKPRTGKEDDYTLIKIIVTMVAVVTFFSLSIMFSIV